MSMSYSHPRLLSLRVAWRCLSSANTMWSMPTGTSAQVDFPPTLMALRPNAQAHLLPEAGARDERTLEAGRCSALFGPVLVKDTVFSLRCSLFHEMLCVYLPRCAGPRMRRSLERDPTPSASSHASRTPRGHGIDATSSARTNWRHAPTNSAG